MFASCRFCKLTLTAILIISLSAGCGADSKAPSDGDSLKSNEKADTNTLTFRIKWKTYSARGEAITRIVDAYNDENPAYRIVPADGDEDLAAIEDLLDHDGPVDIYMLPYPYVLYLGYKGKLDDLTESIQFEEHLFFDNLWQMGAVGQKVYGVPWLGHSMGLLYNKRLLEKAGVDPANIRSPNDLAAACKQVEDKTDAWGIGLVGASHNDVTWMVNQFIYGFGGALVSPDGTKVTINSPDSKKAIEFYKNELGRYAQPSWIGDDGHAVMDYFRNEQVAFEIQSIWGVTDIWKNGNNFKVGVIPPEQIGLYPDTGAIMLSLSPRLSGEEKAAAIEFIQFLTSRRVQDMIMEGEYSPEHDMYYPFRLPVREDVSKSIIFKKYPDFTAFLDGYIRPSIDVPAPLWQPIKEKYYAPGLHSVMEGTTSVDEFLRQIEMEGGKILSGEETEE